MSGVTEARVASSPEAIQFLLFFLAYRQKSEFTLTLKLLSFLTMTPIQLQISNIHFIFIPPSQQRVSVVNPFKSKNEKKAYTAPE